MGLQDEKVFVQYLYGKWGLSIFQVEKRNMSYVFEGRKEIVEFQVLKRKFVYLVSNGMNSLG